MLKNYQNFLIFNKNISFLYEKIKHFLNYYEYLPAYILLKYEIVIFFLISL